MIKLVNKFQKGGSYTVKRGDTLSKIARAHGLSLLELLKLNTSIKNPDLIEIGLSIKIPTEDTHQISDKIYEVLYGKDSELYDSYYKNSRANRSGERADLINLMHGYPQVNGTILISDSDSIPNLGQFKHGYGYSFKNKKKAKSDLKMDKGKTQLVLGNQMGHYTEGRDASGNPYYYDVWDLDVHTPIGKYLVPGTLKGLEIVGNF